jgi:hypothetical protein
MSTPTAYGTPAEDGSPQGRRLIGSACTGAVGEPKNEAQAGPAVPSVVSCEASASADQSAKAHHECLPLQGNKDTR